MWLFVFLALAVAVALPAARVRAQSVLDRPPTMLGAWLGDVGTIQFNFVHRFTESGAPEHQISNSPTFITTTRVPRIRGLVGFTYASSSDVAPRMPNEWEFFLRAVPFAVGNRLADLSVHVGYNQAARSVDGELGLSRRLGRVRLLAAGRAFSNAFDAGEARYAVTGGGTVRLLPHVALAADVGTLLDRTPGERVAWSAGILLGIPNTPHTFSVHATNTNTGTLEGASRGTQQVRYGFEYTVPITIARFAKPSRADSAARPTVDAARAADRGAPRADTELVRDTVLATMQQLAYEPRHIEVAAGTTVVWTNDAPLVHTVTADDGTSFDSGPVKVGARWGFRFTRPGTYAFHCTPHPFMKGVVVVR
ncbi:MAG TPA: plastocyanin/azurin family copper-binding protein [Gemmatimonadaceae bacterium]|nr:plastocyanin/azurin family copper-binding protein [Gemmatimonadaceae bacterium]